MEDSDATTIESLRAKLLSERSASKFARQRVEELHKRVVELEEQLRVVTFQRRKAENAMVDVLISLEKNGFSYFSEEIHSGSDDNGINTESRISDNSGREFCTSPGRSLLQKSFKCCRNHNGKIHGDRGRRRRTSSTSNGGSTPKTLGKSICQTEQGENRTEVVEGVPNAGFYHDGKDVNMEIALEEQAQFIGHHEAEEKAQKEREEKFRGNSNCTLDSYGPGNLSDVKDEKDEVKGLTLQPAEKITSQDRGVKPNGFLAATDIETECLEPQQCSSTVSSESPSEFPGFAISNQRSIEANANWKQQQEGLEQKSLHPPSNVLPGRHSARNSSSHMQGNLLKGESSGCKNKLQVKVLSEKANGLGSVLDALQYAKLSLSNKLSRWPLSRENGQLGRALELEPPVPVPAMRARNGMAVPVGYGRPHGLTMDLQPGGVQPPASMLGSSPGFSSTMYHPEMGVAVSAGNQLGTNHWMEPRPRISTLRQNSEPHPDTGRDSPGYGQYSHILMQRMPSDNKISRPPQSNGMKRRSYSLYDDHSRSMMQE
ncbi:uncharacterized protein LOC117916467 isoform X2 [Vitis riparia]|uniref:uncharacterized protein LOC117916467 isoform X2 n=1 Tax=Vitis riparia TaxID=96939 RepID=UPI00155B17EE|nr:uncharacterized protein LOC117916467 isoform X2 [Vitis riparia]